MDLSIIIVNTNEGHVLVPCLRSVIQQTRDISYEVIVVDNASTDGSAEILAAEFPSVRVIRNSSNLGFAASNNRGIQIARGNFVLLLNPDTEILDGGLQKTVAFMIEHPKAGIVGCKLFYADGKVQHSVRAFPTPWNIFCEASFLYLVFPKSHLFGQYHMTWFDYSTTEAVDWVSGAYFMIRREVIDRLGGLDERFFLYSEELEYCYRTRQLGYTVVFYPGAAIVHHWGGPRTKNKRLIFWGHHSQVLYIKKHFRGLRRFSMLALKYAEVAIRVPVYAVAGLVTLNGRYILKTNAYFVTFWKLLLNRKDW